MTVSSSLSTQTFDCDGSTTVFTCPFRVLEAAEVVGYRITISSNESVELVNGSDFSVTGVGAANAIATTSTAYSNAYRVNFRRRTQRLQLTDYRDNDPFPAESHENALDRLTHIVQEHDTDIGRALLAPEPETGITLPPAAVRADSILAFNSVGQPIAAVPVSGTATDLAINLANVSDAAKGPALVGLNPALNYAAATLGWWARSIGVSVFRWIPTSLHAGIIAGTNTTNLSAYLQAAFDEIETAGGVLNFHAYIYRCDAALDFRRNSTASILQYRYALVGDGAILDFRSSGLTSGSCVKIGATSQANTQEAGKILVSGLKAYGPDSGAITANNARGGTTVGFEFTYCLNLVLERLHALWFYKGYKLNFCFPIQATAVVSQNCCIGLHIGSDCTTGIWSGCGFRNGRFGVLGMPDGTSGACYGQVFDAVNLEGNFVGCVLDPLNGTGVGVHGWEFRRPYLEAIDYDGFRIGTAVNLADASAIGADATRDMYGIKWDGGTWDAGGGTPWGGSGHDAIRGPTSGSTAKPYSLVIQIPVADAGMTLVGCKDVTVNGYKDPVTGSTAANVHALGGQCFVRGDATGATGAKTMRVAKNVASFTKSGTGEFTIAFSRPYASSTAYAVHATAHGGKRYAEVFSTATGSCVVRVYDDTGTLADPTGDLSVACFGSE